MNQIIFVIKLFLGILITAKTYCTVNHARSRLVKVSRSTVTNEMLLLTSVSYENSV